ncbi:MAG: PepSY domain-containing protein [Nitrososphaeraceae archaeon]
MKNKMAKISVSFLAAILLSFSAITINQNYVVEAQPEKPKDAFKSMDSSKDINWTGSIDIKNVLRESFDPLIQTSLSEAITNAENSLNKEGVSGIAAFIHPVHGYLVYLVYALDPENNGYKIVVDAGNGAILSTKQMSIDEMMMKLHNPHGNMMKKSYNPHGNMMKN